MIKCILPLPNVGDMLLQSDERIYGDSSLLGGRVILSTGIIMSTDEVDEDSGERSVQYYILPQADSFTVEIIYPQNSIHRVGGFRSEDEAQTWIGEAQVLLTRSRWFD